MKIEKFTLLPYPENLIYSTYGNSSKIIKPVDCILEEVLNTLSEKEKRALEIVFKNHGDIKDVAEEFAVTDSIAKGFIVKAQRKLRHPSRVKHLNGYVEIIVGEEI